MLGALFESIMKILDLRALYQWYQKHHRPLPFRKSKNPYAIWVSECMLQQTRVAAMLPSYERFMQCFPDLTKLASARQEEVLAAWQGLGYYRRARNLHKGALYLCEKHHASFPKTLEETLAVPGIGPYSAAAILSMAYDLPFAAVDTNIKRVLVRLYYLSEGLSAKALQELAQAQLQKSLDSGYVYSGQHNQALMELGALVCLSGRPDCLLCPLQKHCRSFQKGGIEAAAGLPRAMKKKTLLEIHLKLWLVMDQSREGLLLLKEKNSRFFKDLWVFPYTYQKSSPYRPPSMPKDLRQSLQSINIIDKTLSPHRFIHSITHHKLRVSVESVRLDKKNAQNLMQTLRHSKDENSGLANEKNGNACVTWQWVKNNDLQEYLVNSLALKALAIYDKLNPNASSGPKSTKNTPPEYHNLLPPPC